MVEQPARQAACRLEALIKPQGGRGIVRLIHSRAGDDRATSWSRDWNRAAVDDVFGATDRSRASRCDEGDQVGDFLGLGGAAPWNAAEAVHDDLLATFIVRPGVGCENSHKRRGGFRIDPIRRDANDADPLPDTTRSFLVRVTHAGMNPIDYKLVDMLTETAAFPFVLGIDFAGVVERAPDGDYGLEAGDRVFGMARTHGSYAGYIVVEPGLPREAIARIPDASSDEQAAALPVAGVAAMGGLDLLQLRAGAANAALRKCGPGGKVVIRV